LPPLNAPATVGSGAPIHGNGNLRNAPLARHATFRARPAVGQNAQIRPTPPIGHRR